MLLCYHLVAFGRPKPRHGAAWLLAVAVDFRAQVRRMVLPHLFQAVRLAFAALYRAWLCRQAFADGGYGQKAASRVA